MGKMLAQPHTPRLLNAQMLLISQTTQDETQTDMQIESTQMRGKRTSSYKNGTNQEPSKSWNVMGRNLVANTQLKEFRDSLFEK